MMDLELIRLDQGAVLKTARGVSRPLKVRVLQAPLGRLDTLIDTLAPRQTFARPRMVKHVGRGFFRAWMYEFATYTQPPDWAVAIREGGFPDSRDQQAERPLHWNGNKQTCQKPNLTYGPETTGDPLNAGGSCPVRGSQPGTRQARVAVGVALHRASVHADFRRPWKFPAGETSLIGAWGNGGTAQRHTSQPTCWSGRQ